MLGMRFETDPVVVLETSKGEIRIRCLADEAPIHVASFVELVGQGYYDGLIWHRVVSNFVIQGGDPRGDGWGGAGYTLRDEINRVRYGRGAVGMPKAGKDTGGGQIFITHIPTPHLDGNYTVFGQVVEGLDVVDRIEVGDAIVRARVVQ
jgi:cyclophilin family peptidyl-prolyl cis-trans isomerase